MNTTHLASAAYLSHWLQRPLSEILAAIQELAIEPHTVIDGRSYFREEDVVIPVKQLLEGKAS